MRQAPNQHRRARAGFTLIELLVVMAIIAVLISFISAAAFRVRLKALEVDARSDIGQLSSSIVAFQSANQVSYLPSRIRLRNVPFNAASPYNPNDTYEQASWSYLKKVWPQLNLYQLFANIQSGLSKGWFPDDPSFATTVYYDLEGDQCLVFFLGGLQASGSCRGFSTVRTDPTYGAGVAGQLQGPYFEFKTARLARMGTPSAYRHAIPLSFTDPYGTPYAYFSSWGAVTYNYIPSIYVPLNGVGDCDGLQAAFGRVLPYKEGLSAGVKYYSRDGFQIISAGRDQKFGLGDNTWDARVGYDGANNGIGDDDMSNFHPTLLGGKL